MGLAKALRISSAWAAVIPAHVHDELHRLFLPDDDAAAPFQGPLLQRVVVFPGCAVTVALHDRLTALPWTPTPGRMRATW